MKLRGFEIAKGWEDQDIHLPQRATKHAAGYDIEAATDTTIPVYQLGTPPTLVPTGLKAYCQPDEFYIVSNRSSGARKGLVPANGIGIIDADYYENPTNDGQIWILFFNRSDQPITVHKGERIAQIVFMKYLTVDDDTPANSERTGGLGSTG